MKRLVAFKNADKKVREVFLNGLIQEKGGDYSLTKKGVKFIKPIGRGYDNIPTTDIVRIESVEIIKITDRRR